MTRRAHTVSIDDDVWDRLEKETEDTKVPVSRIVERAVCRELKIEVPD